MDKLKTRIAMLGALLTVALVSDVALAGGSFASTDPVDTGFSDMTTKTNHYGGLLVGLVVIAIGITFGLIWLRKVRQAH